MWGTVMEGNPVNLACVNAEIIPKSPANARVVLILEDHVDVGTVLILENHVDKVALTPEDHADDETIHVRINILTGVQIPQKSIIPTTQLWTP